MFSIELIVVGVQTVKLDDADAVSAILQGVTGFKDDRRFAGRRRTGYDDEIHRIYPFLSDVYQYMK